MGKFTLKRRSVFGSFNKLTSVASCVILDLSIKGDIEMRTEKQQQNLNTLRDIIQYKVNSNQPDEVLNSYISPCGTCRCILGDYIINRDDIKYPVESQHTINQNCCVFRFQNQFVEEFGITEPEGFSIFKSLDSFKEDTMLSRLKIVEGLIRE